MNYLTTGLSIASVLFIWFHTYFLAEYYKLFGLSGWKLMDSFILKSRDGYYMSFPDWIAQNKPRGQFGHWFYSLVSCPFCLGFILTVPLVVCGPFFAGSSYFVSVLGYLILKKLYNS